MKGSPSYPNGVPGDWKIEFLRWLAETQSLLYLIETGTCHGSTPVALYNRFTYIYTVELHDGLYEESRKRFADLDIRNVLQYKGDSKSVLPQMIKDCPPGPTLFWLDAHYTGPHSAGEGDWPLPHEVREICTTRRNSIVVVDDMQSKEGFFGAAQISEESLEILGWKVEYRTGEIIIYQPSLYNIPPFEDA